MVRIGLIGTGNIAHTHVQRLKAVTEAKITALCDPSAQSRETIRTKFGLEEAEEFASHEEMLAKGDVDAVIICSPHTLHYRHTSDALAAGKHALVEKPLACTVGDGNKLIAEAAEAGKVLQVSFQRHFMPAFMYIRSAIQSGKIGKLTSVNATLYQDWKDNQAGTWRQNAKLSGGGMLMDSGSHIIDVLLWTTGLTPESVYTHLHQQGTPVEVDTFTTIRFSEGQVGCLNIIGKAPRRFFEETYAFIGEDGGIFYNGGKIRLIQNGKEPVEPELPESTTDPNRSFVDAILGREEVTVTGDYAVKVLELTEAIYDGANYKP